ncbi:glycosyl transferase [Microbacterium marinilacus]|uniref:DUF8094 domain-containing protein n=1 Tax=Microbacterium marinilacus TaxID=415209 RepID=A0ABP7B450_9MICO|nr:glycosyl transferase [Microbacterium marinilacus]MBY0687988.1 glycosyl transferase [Microbacterium marinilacus]
MRFVWAVIAFVLAAALIGAGIAQRTVFLGPDTATVRIDSSGEQPYTLVDADVFRAHSGTQTLEITGDAQVYAAYGRTADMEAWLSDAPYAHVTLDDEATQASAVPEIATEASDGEGDFAGRDPRGSDLWLQEYEADGELSTRLQLPEGVSVLIASDGTAPAPSEVSIQWPISNATPWAGPLIVAGGLLLLLGLILYALGVRHVRRSRGPRRKGVVMPPTEPLAVRGARSRAGVAAPEPRKEIGPSDEVDADRPGDEPTPDEPAAGAGEGSAQGQRPGTRRGRRALIAVPAFGLSLALLTGCSPDIWPQVAQTPTPTPTPTVVAPENQQAPALTDAQASRIVQEISETVAAADEARDIDLAAQRLDGVVLDLRKVNYDIRGEVEDYPAPSAIPGASVRVLLPQAFDEWPRSAMVVVEPDDDEQAPPTILTISQADQWADYKATSIASLEAAVEIPNLAPSWLGAALVPPDSSFLAIAPNALGDAYADILANGEDSEFASLFDLDGDMFRVAVEEARAETLAGFNETAAETGEMRFEQSAGPGEPLALATLESGAIVSVTVDTRIVTRPTVEDGVVKFADNKGVVALVGEETSTTGVIETATNQLFFSVPARGSSEKIRLLGYASGLSGAQLIEDEPAGEEQ